MEHTLCYSALALLPANEKLQRKVASIERKLNRSASASTSPASTLIAPPIPVPNEPSSPPPPLPQAQRANRAKTPVLGERCVNTMQLPTPVNPADVAKPAKAALTAPQASEEGTMGGVAPGLLAKTQTQATIEAEMRLQQELHDSVQVTMRAE